MHWTDYLPPTEFFAFMLAALCFAGEALILILK